MDSSGSESDTSSFLSTESEDYQSMESEYESQPNPHTAEDLTSTLYAQYFEDVFYLKKCQLVPKCLDRPLSLQSKCVKVIARKISCFNRLGELKLPRPLLRKVYREGITYIDHQTLSKRCYRSLYKNVTLQLFSDKPSFFAEFPTVNIFSEKDVAFSRHFCESFSYFYDRRYLLLNSYINRHKIVGIVYYCFVLDRVQAPLCLKCLKLHVTFSNKSHPNLLKRKYLYSLQRYAILSCVENHMWCLCCQQTPLFQLLDRKKMYQKYRKRVRNATQHYLRSQYFNYLKTERLRISKLLYL